MLAQALAQGLQQPQGQRRVTGAGRVQRLARELPDPRIAMRARRHRVPAVGQEHGGLGHQGAGAKALQHALIARSVVAQQLYGAMLDQQAVARRVALVEQGRAVGVVVRRGMARQGGQRDVGQAAQQGAAGQQCQQGGFLGALWRRGVTAGLIDKCHSVFFWHENNREYE